MTRMGVHDDFKLFFDPSKTSMQNDIYTVKSDAQLLYGERCARPLLLVLVFQMHRSMGSRNMRAIRLSTN